MRPVAARKQFTKLKISHHHEPDPKSVHSQNVTAVEALLAIRGQKAKQTIPVWVISINTVPITPEVLEKICRDGCWKVWWLCTMKLVLPDLDLDPLEWDTAQIQNKGFLSLRSLQADCETKAELQADKC